MNRKQRVARAEKIVQDDPIFKTCPTCRVHFAATSKLEVFCSSCFDLLSGT